MMHDHHGSLPGYNPNAILHDGCVECEERAARGVGGLLELDANNLDLLWQRVLNTEYGGRTPPNDAGEYQSDCESKLGHHLYLIGVLLQNHEDVWHLDRFISPARFKVRP